MALITSAQSGNFNDTATWTGGVVPTVGDEARAATGHTITITANATCDEVSNAGTGMFVLADGVTLSANVTNKSTTTNRTCLQFSAATPSEATISGNCLAGSVLGSTAVTNSGTGKLNIVGSCTAGSGGGNAYGANNASSGVIVVTGNCTGGSVAGASQNGANNASTGTLIITGNCTGGTISGGSPSGANNASTGTLIITGNCYGGPASSSGVGASNSSTGMLSVIGSIQATQFGPGVSGINNQQVTILSGPFLTETTRGVAPVYCAAWRWNASPSNSTYMEVMTNNLFAKRNLYTADNITGMPAASNVKSGVQYGPSSELTGTLATTTSPSASDIRDAVWGAATSGMTTSGSIGERLKNASTLATTGQQIADAVSA